MNIKKSSFALAILCAASMLTACGAEFPELNEEQTELVNEYAASLLLKYDANSTSRLLTEEEMQGAMIVPVGPEDSQPVVSEEEVVDINKESDEPLVSMDDVTVNDIDGTTSTPEKMQSAGNGWTDYCLADGFDISYAGNYEIVDSYPVDDPNAYFTMDASAGNKLLVLHFNLVNTSGTDLNVDMNKYGLRYRVSVNGGVNSYILTTMLSNDVLSFVGDVPTNESVDLIAVAELSESEASNIQSLVFTIRGDNGSSQLNLN